MLKYIFLVPSYPHFPKSQLLLAETLSQNLLSFIPYYADYAKLGQISQTGNICVNLFQAFLTLLCLTFLLSIQGWQLAIKQLAIF
jgi:hypothetical protein